MRATEPSSLRALASDGRLRHAFLFSDMLVLAIAKPQRSMVWSAGGAGERDPSGAPTAQYNVTHRLPLRAVRCLSDGELWGPKSEGNGNTKERQTTVNVLWDRPSPYAPVCVFLAPLGVTPRLEKGAAESSLTADLGAATAAAGVVIEWEKRYASGGPEPSATGDGGGLDWTREIEFWAAKCKNV